MFAKFARFISRYWICGARRLGRDPRRAVSRCAQVGRDHARRRFRLFAADDDQRARRGTPGKGLSGSGLQEQRRAGGRPAGRRTYRRRQGRRPAAWPTMFTPKPDEKTPVASVMTHDDKIRRAASSAAPTARSVLVVLAVEQRVHGRRQHAVHQRGLPQGAGDPEGAGLSRRPAIGGDRFGARRFRHALVDEGEHRQHRTDDDPAGDGHLADRLSLAGAGAGAAGVDRRFLFRVAQPHCPGGPMGRSAPGTCWARSAAGSAGSNSTSRFSRRPISSSSSFSSARRPTIACS